MEIGGVPTLLRNLNIWSNIDRRYTPYVTKRGVYRGVKISETAAGV